MINLTAQLDTAEINRKMREVYANAKQMTSGVVTESEKMDIAMMRFKNTLISTAAQIGGGIGLFQLAKQIATTRGEFQQLEVAFTTLLQSKAKADALMSEMVTLAAKTPFDLQGVASGARQLLAYGFSADKTTDILTRLGNVAAGLGLPLERLTYLYGTTAVQGRLYARDMLQFTGSGIPVLQEMAKMYGKTTEEINAMVSAGKIGFKDVEKVFVGMTDQGGKFYNLMQEQSKTINGQISNLSDAIDMMFNNIGKSQEGVINSAISGAAYLVENYEKILKILVPLVATYGAYKASLMAVAAVQSAAVGAQYAIEAAELQKLLLAKEANKNADIEAAVAKGRLTEEQSKNILSIRAEVAAHLESLKVSAMQASAEQANAAIALKNARLNAFNAKQAFQQAQINLSLAKLSGDAKQIEAAQESLLSAERNQSTAANLRNSASKELGIAKSKAVAAATVVETAQTNINTAATTAATRAQKLFAGVSVLTTNAVRALKATLASFLPVAIIAAVGMLAYKLYEVATAETEAEKATKRLREANKDFETSVLKETSALNIMFDRLKRAKEGTTEYAEAKKAIQDKYGPLLSSMGQEVRSLNNITEAQKALTAAILDTAKARAREGYVGEAASSSASKQGEAITNIRDQLYKNRGEAEGRAILDSIKGILQKYDTGEAGAGTWEELRKVLFDVGIKPSYKSAKNPVADYILEQAKTYSGAARELREASREAEDIWGRAPEKTDNKTIITISEDLKIATKEYNDALAAWDKGVKDNLETGVVSKLKQEAEDAKKRLEDIKSALGIDPKAAAKAGSDALKSQNEIDDARLKNQLAAQKERIDAMQDGKAKELAQIKADKIAKLAAIDKEEQEMTAKYAKMGQAVPQGETDTFTVRRKIVTAEVEKKYAKEIEDLYTQIGSVWLTEEEKKRAEIKKTYDGMREELKALYMGGGMTGGDYLSGLWNIEQAEDQTGTKNLIDDYITYTQRREKIEKKFNDDIAAMQAKNADGSLSKNIEDAERQRKEATEALDVEIASREEVFNVWAGNIADMSIARLQEVLAKAQEELDKLEKNGGSDDKTIAAARAKVSTAQKALNKAEAVEDLAPGKRTLKEWKDLYETLQDVQGEFDKIGDAVGGVAGEIIDTAGQIATSTLSMINGIVQLANWAIISTKMTAEGVAASIQTVEKASVILTIISAAMQIAMTIVNLFNNDKQHQKNIEALQSRIDELQWMLDNADIVRLQKNTVNILQQVRDVYAQTTQEVLKLHLATEQYANGFIRSIGAGIYQNEIMAASIDKLAVAYMSVGYTADKALGGQNYKGAQDQLKNIAQQQLLIQQQINEEDAKKKTDHGQIAEWEQQIAELGAEAIKIINEMVEDIIGGSAEEIAGQLGDAFIEAFQAGEDAAQAWGDKVDEIVADIMKRMFIQKFIEEPLGEIFDKYKKQWFDPDKGFSLDAVIDSMGQFKDDLNNAGDTVQDIWESLPDDIKDMFNPKDAKQQATSKGFQTMSQETGSELNGRFTVMTDIMAKSMEIQKQMRDAGLNIADATFNIRDLTIQANSHLSAISKNTNELFKMNDRLKKIEENTAYLK